MICATNSSTEPHNRINKSNHFEQDVQYTDVTTSARTLLTETHPYFKTNKPNVLIHMLRHSASHLVMSACFSKIVANKKQQTPKEDRRIFLTFQSYNNFFSSFAYNYALSLGTTTPFSLVIVI